MAKSWADISEADLAAAFTAHFVAAGYACWAEVQRIDIVALRDGVPTGIEVKKSFTHHLVAQALQAQAYCGAAVMAMPRVADAATLYVRDAVIEKSGLGCVECWDWGYATTAHDRFEIRTVAEPSRRLHDGLDYIKKLLVPESKDWTTAGHPCPRAVTPFRVSAIRIRDYVRDHVGCTAAEVVAEVPTHWSGNAASKSKSLLVSVTKGWIDGVQALKTDGSATTLIPA